MTNGLHDFRSWWHQVCDVGGCLLIAQCGLEDAGVTRDTVPFKGNVLDTSPCLPPPKGPTPSQQSRTGNPAT